MGMAGHATVQALSGFSRSDSFHLGDIKMIAVYHRADHDCIVVEHADEKSTTYVHYHQSSGQQTLREIIVETPENGAVFSATINPDEPECDQTRRR